MMDLPDRISFVPLCSLQAWERNYRRGDVDAIAASIRRFGFNSVLRVRKGVVFAGNHAFKALEAMEEAEESLPKGIVSDPAGGWLVPCVDIGHLAESEAMAFAIADNRTQELGTNDEAALADILADLRREDDTLLDDIGYSSIDIEALMGEPDPPASSGKEFTETIEQDVTKATCPECGHEFPL